MDESRQQGMEYADNAQISTLHEYLLQGHHSDTYHDPMNLDQYFISALQDFKDQNRLAPQTSENIKFSPGIAWLLGEFE